MNDDLDINLPADADDLSKHAPALFALKRTEEGFVVPALYFEELSELIISKTTIPQDGGLVVPENYFEESVELIVSKTTLPTEDGLIVPENYFEELPAIVEAKTAIPADDGLVIPEKYFEEFTANIESQIALENILPKTEEEIPAGYFSEMENELHVHIALDNVKQDEGFVVPAGYFSDLTDRVLAETSLEKSEINSDEVPPGYFDTLADKVVARIENENKEEKGRVIVLSQWKKYTAITTVAAAVALLIVFTYTFSNNSDNGKGDLAYVPKTKSLVPENYVKEVPQNVIDTNSSIIIPVPQNTNTQIANNPPGIKPKKVEQVIMNDDEIIAQSDLMDETLVMEFVTENNVIEPAEEVLDPAMMEYLMNDNNGLEGFDPTDKK